MVCERPPAAFGGSPPPEGETQAKLARGSLTHRLELQLSNTPVSPGREAKESTYWWPLGCSRHYREPRAGARGYILPQLRDSDWMRLRNILDSCASRGRNSPLCSVSRTRGWNGGLLFSTIHFAVLRFTS